MNTKSKNARNIIASDPRKITISIDADDTK